MKWGQNTYVIYMFIDSYRHLVHVFTTVVIAWFLWCFGKNIVHRHSEYKSIKQSSITESIRWCTSSSKFCCHIKSTFQEAFAHSLNNAYKRISFYCNTIMKTTPWSFGRSKVKIYPMSSSELIVACLPVGYWQQSHLLENMKNFWLMTLCSRLRGQGDTEVVTNPKRELGLAGSSDIHSFTLNPTTIWLEQREPQQESHSCWERHSSGADWSRSGSEGRRPLHTPTHTPPLTLTHIQTLLSHILLWRKSWRNLSLFWFFFCQHMAVCVLFKFSDVFGHNAEVVWDDGIKRWSCCCICFRNFYQ